MNGAKSQVKCIWYIADIRLIKISWTEHGTRSKKCTPSDDSYQKVEEENHTTLDTLLGQTMTVTKSSTDILLESESEDSKRNIVGKLPVKIIAWMIEKASDV